MIHPKLLTYYLLWDAKRNNSLGIISLASGKPTKGLCIDLSVGFFVSDFGLRYYVNINYWGLSDAPIPSKVPHKR